MERIECSVNLITWVTFMVLIILVILKNKSIGIEYTMIWLLLAFLGFTISREQLIKSLNNHKR